MTGRYEKGDKVFQLVTSVTLQDGEVPVRVEVEFLASADIELKRHHPKLVEGFRVLQFPIAGRRRCIVASNSGSAEAGSALEHLGRPQVIVVYS